MSYALVVAKTVFHAEKAIGLVTDSLSTTVHAHARKPF